MRFRIFLVLVLLKFASAGPSGGRIVNGEDADIVDFPWTVSLRVGTQFVCGGAIIAAQWILTAAHCEATSIQYGKTVIDQTSENTIDVDDFIRHEAYDDFTLENDIALAKLSQPIPFNGIVRPVNLPEAFSEIGDESWTTVSDLVGWGLDRSGGSVQETLQKVKLYIVNSMDCGAMHEATIWDTNICAGVPEGGKGQCSGDSGGPLTVEDVVRGIVSWSIKPCASDNTPGVFTKVSFYIDWIAEQSGLDFGKKQ